VLSESAAAAGVLTIMILAWLTLFTVILGPTFEETRLGGWFGRLFAALSRRFER
jgi:hypothetical protein